MAYIIRKTQLADIDQLPPVERAAGNAFKTLPDLAWIADDDLMPAAAHERYVANGLSWVALDCVSQTICGFIHADIIEGEFYVGEVSVSELHQKKGIGSTLFDAALTEAKALGLSAATLTTFKDVPWNAPYYERLGFKILTAETLPLYLTQKLQDEIISGLPADRRCAMRKAL